MAAWHHRSIMAIEAKKIGESISAKIIISGSVVANSGVRWHGGAPVASAAAMARQRARLRSSAAAQQHAHQRKIWQHQAKAKISA